MTADLDYIYDFETYPDIWTCAVEHATSDQEWFFEISEKHNDYYAFCQFMYQLSNLGARMVGYNNIGFDYPIAHDIINGLITNAYNIYLKCQSIIDDGSFKHMVWESDWIVEQIDLFKIHHFDNRAKSTSLKVLEFNMRSWNIEDLPFEPGKNVGRENYPILRSYNRHDVKQTKKFYWLSQPQIKMREELTTKHFKNFMNHNDTKIGKDYFIMKLEEAIPGSCYYKDQWNRKQPRQTIRASIDLNTVVFPYIAFEQSEFTRVLNYFKAQRVTETKGVYKNLSAIINGFSYDFGLGGIHGSVSSQTVVSDNYWMILDIDVDSFYTNLAIANRLFPEHLGEGFCDIYIDVYNQRKNTTKKTPENDMLKLALNGVYGDSNNVYSPFYDPAYTMSITINGQLLLCMLAEQLIKSSELTMIQVNTDGLTVRIPRHLEQWVNEVCDCWERFTLLELERVEYNRMFIRDVNNYIGEFTDGSLKRKGAYAHDRDDIRELPWHKDHSALVVKKAAEAALVNGQDIGDFIRNHKDIMDFMKRAKVPRSSKLVGMHNVPLVGETARPLQNITRYYITDARGVELVKLMPPLAKNKPTMIMYDPTRETDNLYTISSVAEYETAIKDGLVTYNDNEPMIVDPPWRRIGIDVGWKVCPCNNLDNMTAPINFDYYIEQANKLVEPLR